MSLIRLPIFFLLFHLFLPHLLHQLPLLYHLAGLRPYISLLCLGDLNSAIHLYFAFLVMCRIIRLIWMLCALHRCGQAIERLPYVIFTRCCMMTSLWHGSIFCYIVVNVECMGPAAQVPRLNTLLSAVTKRSIMRRVYRGLGAFLMNSLYRKLLSRLSSYVLRLLISISPKHVNYWARGCDFELRLSSHTGGVFPGLHNVELFTIPLLHRPSHNIKTPGWWRKLGASRLLCFDLLSNAS